MNRPFSMNTFCISTLSLVWTALIVVNQFIFLGASAIAKPRVAAATTPLDEYVAAEDDSFGWEVVARHQSEGATDLIVDLASQTWRTNPDVDRTIWRHWLMITVPDQCQADTALLFISGGANDHEQPERASDRSRQVALATRSVVAELRMVPNQPLVFHNDGQRRFEDDLLAYTWNQYLLTEDPTWPGQLPMTKAAVRAMDAVQHALAAEPSPIEIRQFVVTGGSKRGWTTWLTAAVDDRVTAIAPLVIDVLNIRPSMKHHESVYQFWAPALNDYVEQQLPEKRDDPRYRKLLSFVDPYSYRDRLTMPKCVINASGDEFFVPDSSQFYYDDLPGEKLLCYAPNASHSLEGSKALDTLIAFHASVVHGLSRPEVQWTETPESEVIVRSSPPADKARLWRATNPTARDFRVETIGTAYESTELPVEADGEVRIALESPAKGWSASFVELEFDIGAPTPLRATTRVWVTPDIYPSRAADAAPADR